jgi:hypothetical protein
MQRSRIHLRQHFEIEVPQPLLELEWDGEGFPRSILTIVQNAEQ